MAETTAVGALPLFARDLRSRTSSGIYGPARSAGSSTGVLQHVRICKAKGRSGSVAGGVEEVDVVGNVPKQRVRWVTRWRCTRIVSLDPRS